MHVEVVTIVGVSVLSQMRRILSAIMRKLIVSYANVAAPDAPVCPHVCVAVCVCVYVSWLTNTVQVWKQLDLIVYRPSFE